MWNKYSGIWDKQSDTWDKHSSVWDKYSGIWLLEKEKAQIEHDNIDKLIMEYRKDLFSDGEDFDE